MSTRHALALLREQEARLATELESVRRAIHALTGADARPANGVQLTVAIIAFVAAHPGCYARDIFDGLGTTKRPSARQTLFALSRDGRIRAEGARPMRRYYPAEESES